MIFMSDKQSVLFKISLKSINNLFDYIGLVIVLVHDHDCLTQNWGPTFITLEWKGFRNSNRRKQWNNRFGVKK